MTARVVFKQRETIAEAAWALACTLPKFGTAELSIGVKARERTVAKIVRDWAAEGRLIVEQPASPRVRGMWRIDPSFVPKRVVGRTVEDCAWTAMRQSKTFSPRILAASASTEAIEVTVEFAQAYCRSLLTAGYLVVVRKAVPGKTEPMYRLVKNTGPRAPRERRVRAVVDENTAQTILIGGAA